MDVFGKLNEQGITVVIITYDIRDSGILKSQTAKIFVLHLDYCPQKSYGLTYSFSNQKFFTFFHDSAL